MAEGAASSRRRPGSFRERLHVYSDAELINRYRLDREGIMYVTDLVRDTLSRPTARNQTISPEQKVMTTLRYLATGKMQQCSSDDLGPSQQTISTVIKETVYALSTLDILERFIQFPLSQEATAANARAFQQIAGMHGIFGVIDGTHVKLTPPRGNESAYVNLKGQHTINIQVVFDHKYNIIDIVAQWPGSVPDARILRESPLFRICERGHIPPGSHLLGDTAYPSRRWLLTPYLRPLPGAQTNYNRAHKRTRSVVERGIGQWKRRFPILNSEINVKVPAYACRIVEVCAMLHNLCKERNIMIPGEVDEEHQRVVPQPQGGGQANEGLGYRDTYVDLHFNVAPHPHAPPATPTSLA